ncbi:MAG: molybdopterin-dependent oxidoreductase [Alishewanella aestuarii]
MLFFIPTAFAEESPYANFVTSTLQVSGHVEQPLQLTVAQLAAEFALHQDGNFPLICQSGANKGKLEHFKGVLLRDILSRAKIISREHNELKKIVIIATASDDYKAVFSWNELFNSELGEGVLVFFEKNGAQLNDFEGKIALVSSKDIRTGPRHVRWLKQIDVVKITD